MSQRGEKYARSMERRTVLVEQRMDSLDRRMSRAAVETLEHERRIWEIEDTLKIQQANHDNEVDVRRQDEVRTAQENRRQRREIERDLERQRRGMVLALLLAIIALIVAVKAAGTERAPETIQPTAHMTAKAEVDLLASKPEEFDPWAFVALYRAAEDPLEAERIGEALEAQGYFSTAVPLSWEYQDYMRTYCHLYGCPYWKMAMDRIAATVVQFDQIAMEEALQV